MIHNLQGIHETVDYKADTQICLYYNDEAENYPPHWHPSFEVISPLLSRCQVYVLKSLDKNDLLTLLNKAIKEDIVLKD